MSVWRKSKSGTWHTSWPYPFGMAACGKVWFSEDSPSANREAIPPGDKVCKGCLMMMDIMGAKA